MSVVPASSGRLSALAEDLAKIPAFFRRDLLILWSYRTAFFSDWINMLVQVMVFYFLSRIIPSESLPEFGGQPTTYIQYVTVAIALTAFVSISIGRVTSAVNTEQNQGTLEALLMTPTASSTIQLGWVVYDLLYVPLRTTVFLLLMSGLLGVTLSPAGILPTVVMFIPFIPFVWGIGVMSAAAILTFRRGHGLVGLWAALLTLTSGAYFPIENFPGWLQKIAELNPMTGVLNGAREALLGNPDWSDVWKVVIPLMPLAAITLALGAFAFQLALGRERRRGTLGLY
jgi:ABC-type polysaccharide/polyol phosphate export permease